MCRRIHYIGVGERTKHYPAFPSSRRIAGPASGHIARRRRSTTRAGESTPAHGVPARRDAIEDARHAARRA
jgi:hypothetical protein